MHKCTHTRKPLFTTDYCAECDVQPSLYAPQPLEPMPTHKPTNTTGVYETDIDPGNCINPFDVMAVCDSAIVENRSDITMYYKVNKTGQNGELLYLWSGHAFTNMVYSNSTVKCDKLLVSMRSQHRTISHVSLLDNVMVVSIAC